VNDFFLLPFSCAASLRCLPKQVSGRKEEQGRTKSLTSRSLSLFTASPEMVQAPRVARWMPALRVRRTNQSPNYSTHASPQPLPNLAAPRTFRKRDLVLRGPALLLRGPGLLLRAPKAVLRAPGAARARTQRLFSSARPSNREQNTGDQGIEYPQAGPSNGGKGPQNEGNASFTCS